MKTKVAFLAVVVFVAVGAFPTSPVLPPLIPHPAPKSITNSSRTHAGSSHAASAESDKGYTSIGPDGTRVTSNEKISSAEKKDGHQYTHGDHGISSDGHGGYSSWGLDGDHRRASEGKSAAIDKELVVKDASGTRVQKEKGSSAAAKSAYDDVHKGYKTVVDGKGGYKSERSDYRKVGNSQGSSAASDKALKIINKDGSRVTSNEKISSAEKKDGHQYTHGDHGISSDGHGGYSSWGLDGDHRRASEGKSAAIDKELVVKDADGTRVQKEKGSSASDKSAYDDVHKGYKTVVDGKGGYHNDRSDYRKVGNSQGSSAASDKVLKIINNDGTRVTSNEKISSAEKKDGHQYTHGDHGISSDGHGGYSSWGLDGDHRRASEGKSAAIDKDLVVKDASGTRVQKEKGSSAAAKSAYDDVHKGYKTVVDGKGGYKSERSDYRKVGNSQGSSAASDKALKIINKDGSRVTSNEKISSAEKKDGHQYTHGDHGISSDGHGGYSSWGLDGDHRRASEGKSAKIDKELVVKDASGTRVQKEKGSSASDKSDYDDVHKGYKTVVDGKGGYKSDRSDYRKVGNSQGSSAASDKVLKIINNDGTRVTSNEKISSAEKKDGHQYTHGDHGISSDGHGGYSSWGLDGDHRRASEGKSAAIDKELVVKDASGTRVQKEKGSSAAAKSAYDDVHKGYKTVVDGKGGYKSERSDYRKVGNSQGSSAASDKALKIINKDGSRVTSNEKISSAEKKDGHQYTHGDHGISSDGHGGYSSWGLDGDHRRASEGKSAAIDKELVVKDASGTRVQKEKGSSAAAKSAYDDVHKGYKTVVDGKGGYKSERSDYRKVGNSQGSSAASDKALKIINKDGSRVTSNEKISSAEKKDGHQYTHGDHGISSDGHGGYSSWGLDGDHRRASEGKSAEIDKELVVKDASGTRVQKEKGSSASDKSAYDDVHKGYKTVVDGKGGYKSDRSDYRKVGNSQGSSAASDKVLKIINNDGTRVTSNEKISSAEKKDGHQYTHGDHGILSDGHGGYSIWGLDGDHRRAREGKSAAIDKELVVKDADGTRVQKEKGSSASDRSAYDNVHKGYKTVVDGKGGYHNDRSDYRKVGNSQGSSAASDKVLKIINNDGTRVTSNEKISSAEKKDGHQYTHGDHGISSDGHGGYSSWGLDGDHRRASEGKSAAIDKELVVKDASGTRVQKEKGSSAAAKSAYDDVHKGYKTVVDGKGGYKSERSDYRKVGNSQGSSAASDKALKIINKDGSRVTSNEKISSAEKKDGHQYTHGDHGTSSDAHGGYSSWGLDGDHRRSSEGKSAAIDKELIVKDASGTRVQKEKGSSAAAKSAYDDVHKGYKTVVDGKGGYRSDRSDYRKVGYSQGSSAASDKVLKIINNDGTRVTSNEKISSAEKKDGHQYTHGDHGISSDGHGGYSSWGLDGDHRRTSEGKSAAIDKELIVKDASGTRVQKEKGSSASDKSDYDDVHKGYKTVVDGKGGYENDRSVDRQVGNSQGLSTAVDKVLKVIVNDGLIIAKELADSASRDNNSEKLHSQQKTKTNADGYESSNTYSKDLASNRAASNSHNKEYQSIGKKGKSVTIKDQGAGASIENRTSGDYNNQNRYSNIHGSGTSNSNGTYASADKQASDTHNREYKSVGEKGESVSITDQGAGASRETQNSGTHHDQGTSTGNDGSHNSWNSKGSDASLSKQASDSHNKKYESVGAKGESVSIVDQGAGASTENRNSGNYNNQNKYDGPNGSGDSKSIGDYASVDKQASDSHDKKYESVGKKGESVKIIDQGTGASRENKNSANYNNQNTYSNKYGSGTSDSKGTHASTDKQASDSHNKKYESVGKKGESVTIVDQGAGASRQTQNSRIYSDQSTSAGNDGSHNSWSYKGNDAALSKQASDSHNKKYQSVGAQGESVSIVDQEAGASTENRSSGNYNNEKTYDGLNGSGTFSNKGNYASADKQASDSHNREYQSVGKSGESVKIKDQGAGASNESGSSGTYIGQSTYTGPHGSGKSSSQGTNASADKQASNSHNKEYQSVGKSGESVRITDTGSAASKQSGNSGCYSNKMTNENNDGSSSSSKSSGNYASANNAASKSDDKSYESIGKDGKYTYIRNTGDAASESSGTSSNNKNQGTSKNADGSSESWSTKDNAATAHKGASDSNKSVLIEKNPNGSSRLKASETANASVADGSSSNNQSSKTSVGADGTKTAVNSKSSKASKSSASSSSSKKVEVIKD